MPKTHAYLLSPGQPTPGTPTLLRPPIALRQSAGILTSFPSTTRFRLALGTDSPCADERCARKPWAFGGEAFHPPYRYSCQHSHFRYLQQTLRSTFTGVRNAPLPRIHSLEHTQPSHSTWGTLVRLRRKALQMCSSGVDTPRASVHGLAPLNLPRGPTRPVSYYAFFKGWLLLSQPPGCLCLPTSFTT